MLVDTILREKGTDVITILPEAPVREALALLIDRRIGAVVVCATAGPPLGIFSERDLARELHAHGSQVLELSVKHVMTEIVYSCSRDTPITEVMAHMTRRRIRHIPVVEDGKLLGIVSIGDAVKARIEESVREAAALREYIAT